MENASKALIIAGAILLAILLISLGILIFNQAQDTVNNTGMSQAEITSLNNKFLKYEGIQNATGVKSMMNEVFVYNSDNTHGKIQVFGRSKKTDSQTEKTEGDGTEWINTSISYEVKVHSYYPDGTISKIRVDVSE